MTELRVAELLLRTEASVTIGTGHVMRCLALAQAWCDAGGRAVFAMAESTPAVEERLRRERFELVRIAVRVAGEEDAEETARLAHRRGASWVVVDGYDFGGEYQASLKSRGLRVLFLDDNGHAGHYSADIVLNQNVYADQTMYPNRSVVTRLLLGPSFAMLRREFAQWRSWRRETPDIARRVLVTMGGSDPNNFTRKAVEGIRAVGDESLRIRVLAGGSNPHIDSLEKFRTEQENSIELVRDASDMPGQMSWADFAVAGAGSVCLEMCLMGLPALLVDLAENQTAIAIGLARRGTAYHLGNSKTLGPARIASETRRLQVSPEDRTSMSQRGRELVDGQGAGRVVRELIS